MRVPVKFINGFSKNLKKYQTIINKYKKDKKVNETETIKVVNDILFELFGYDKYNDITSEYITPNGRCDLAIRNSGKNGKIYMFIEVKKVTAPLNDNHIEQAVEYGRDGGVKWVVLTNAEDWKVYKIENNKKKNVFEFNLLKLNLKNQKESEKIYAISKLGREKSVIEEIYSINKTNNKYVIAAILNRPETYKNIRRLIRKYLDKTAKITESEIEDYITNHIMQSDVVNSHDAIDAQKYVNRQIRNTLKNC
ncbi:MAG: type I restriction enzyme HsdR N-terminal domain-containing protein [Alphaproteobacteria bacterium]|nr:type I restriction enzyme HsdR N-terminal domain-containing protein [Alphaproteobacteria bacterium]